MLDWNDDNDYYEYKQFQKEYKDENVHIRGGFSVLRMILVLIGIAISCGSLGFGFFYFMLYLSLRLSGWI